MNEKAGVKSPEVKREISLSQKQSADLSQPGYEPFDHTLYLQRNLGNQVIQRLMESETKPAVQSKKPSLQFVTSNVIQRDCQDFPGHTDPGTYCETRAEAEARVANANPANCFVYSDGPEGHLWRPIPGRGGCAHYVAHELGITVGPPHANCIDGFSVTIDQITDGRNRLALSNAQVNDIWTNSGEGHSGVVREVGTGANAGQVRIQACGLTGNIYSQWRSDGFVHR